MRRFNLSLHLSSTPSLAFSPSAILLVCPAVLTGSRSASTSTTGPTGGSPPSSSSSTTLGDPIRRQNIGKIHPHLQQTLMDFEKQAHAALIKAGFSEGFAHLIQLRSSQINKCAFCARHHTREAIKPVTEPSGGGESMDRIAVLPAWRDTTGYFSAKEKAALGLLEAITNIAEGQIPDEVYAEAAGALSPEELSAVQWISVSINAWNRVGIISRYQVKP